MKPVEKAGRSKRGTATTGALKRRPGLTLKTSVRRRAAIWHPSSLMPPETFFSREWKEVG